MKRLERHACHKGHQEVWEHTSPALGDTTTSFGVYLPPQSQHAPCPVLYWLSGLTCTAQNFITKAGAQAWADEHGIVIVAPDTSPRGEDVANAPEYDLGQGAGFYLNATQEPWAAHYNMHEHIVHELPQWIEHNFPVTDKKSISGHSMGGHGALVLGLKHPDRYQSVSAFSPIVAPSQVPWGQKAFSAYLGEDESTWGAWDACKLVESGHRTSLILIDQGTQDQFLEPQLKPHLFEDVCQEAGQRLTVRMQEGFDHSYYFIASFIQDHLQHHASALL